MCMKSNCGSHVMCEAEADVRQHNGSLTKGEDERQGVSLEDMH